MRKPKESPRLAVILSDLHVGSTVAIWPEGFVSSEGVPIGLNKIQEWILDRWNATLTAIKQITNGDPYVLIINGDLTEGIHHKTLQVMSADIGDQVKACAMLLAPVAADAHALYIVLGTECHTGNLEYIIGKELGAVRNPENGLHAFDELHLEIHGTYGTVRHHIGTAGNPYLESGGLGRAMNTEIMEAARCGARIPRWMMRAHRHKHGVVNDGNSMLGVTGAWQLLTRFGKKVVPAALCQPSAMILDWRTREKNTLPQTHEIVIQPKPKRILAV